IMLRTQLRGGRPMTNRSHSPRRRSPWLVAPAVAVAAIALTACSNGEESAPADATYSLPPVFTGAPDPSMVDGAPAGAAGTATSEAEKTSGASDTTGFTASLTNTAGDQVGTVQLGDKQGDLTVAVELDDSSLQAGMYKVAVTDNGACVAAD